MGIMDELNSIDKKLQDDLEQKRIDAKRAEEYRKNIENERIEFERNARKERKKQKIQDVLEGTDEGLDDPHIYMIEYFHDGGGGYGYGKPVKPGKSSCEVIMSEREKRIAQLTGYMKECTDAPKLAYGCRCKEITSVTLLSRELSEEEKMKISAAKQKISIIKNNKEAENGCVLELDDDEFGSIQIYTSLRNALLSSISIENGKVKTQEESKQQNGKNKSNLPVKAESKISLKTLKETIKKVLGRGEK